MIEFLNHRKTVGCDFCRKKMKCKVGGNDLILYLVR